MRMEIELAPLEWLPAEKWNAIAAAIWEAFRIPVKGDTLRKRLYPAYIEKREAILREWLPQLEAYANSLSVTQRAAEM
jgi:hypothetical protein